MKKVVESTVFCVFVSILAFISTGFSLNSPIRLNQHSIVNDSFMAGKDSSKIVYSHADSLAHYDKVTHTLILYKNAMLKKYPFIVKADHIEYKDLEGTGFATGNVTIENISQHVTSTASTASFKLK